MPQNDGPRQAACTLSLTLGFRNSRHCLFLPVPSRSQHPASLTMKRALALMGLAFLCVLRAGASQQTVDDACSVQILVPGLKGMVPRPPGLGLPHGGQWAGR